MSKEAEDSDIHDEGLAALAALVSPSVAPPGRSADEEEDDGKIDLGALVASVPPPPKAVPEESMTASGEMEIPGAPRLPDELADSAEASAKGAKGAEASAKGKKSKAKKKPLAKAQPGAAEEAEAAPVAAAVPAKPEKEGGSKTNLVVGILIGAAVAAGMFFFMRNGSEQATGTTVASASQSSATQTTVTPGEGTPGEETQGASAQGGGGAQAGAEAQAAAGGEGAAGAEAEAGGEEGAEAQAGAEGGEGAEPAAAGSPGNSGNTPAATHRRVNPGANPFVRQNTTAAQANTGASAGTGGNTAQSGSNQRTTTATATGGSSSANTGVENLLDQALGGRPQRDGTTVRTTQDQGPRVNPTPSSNAPESLGAREVAQTLGRLMSRVRACAGDQQGMGVANIVVRNDGTVVSAQVSGSPFGGTPQGTCMEGVLQSAQFPAFRNPSQRIRYPISIRSM